MSLYDYEVSKEIVAEEYPLNALIMAVMSQEDVIAVTLLRENWPNIWNELQNRNKAPGGYLDTEEMEEGIHQRP